MIRPLRVLLIRSMDAIDRCQTRGVRDGVRFGPKRVPEEPIDMIYPGLPDDQRVLAAIGKIALRHGQLDYALKMAVTGARVGWTSSRVG
jgi:hypothetical protein